MTRYVAYAHLRDVPSGGEVDPDDFGGVDSDDFQYMLDRRTVVPMGDPDAPAPPEGAPAREWIEGQAAASTVGGLGELTNEELDLIRAHRAKAIQAQADAAVKGEAAATKAPPSGPSPARAAASSGGAAKPS